MKVSASAESAPLRRRAQARGMPFRPIGLGLATGVGNGTDGQPPGDPPVNDGEGTAPGSPGNGPSADAETLVYDPLSGDFVPAETASTGTATKRPSSRDEELLDPRR